MRRSSPVKPDAWSVQGSLLVLLDLEMCRQWLGSLLNQTKGFFIAGARHAAQLSTFQLSHVSRLSSTNALVSYNV